MLTLSAKIRKDLGKKSKKIRKNGMVPAVLYGPKIKPQPIEVSLNQFKKVLKEAGESSLISLQVDQKKYMVLIHAFDRDPLTSEIIHIDFYQPILTKEVEVAVPLVFEGEAPAVKDFGGTFIKEISEIMVKALPEKLPYEIKVDIGSLRTFENEILVKDLNFPEGVKILRDPNDIVAVVTPPEKVEEELEKPIEEKVEEVEKVEAKKEKEAEAEEAPKAETKKQPENKQK